jgi:hypothetical protein
MDPSNNKRKPSASAEFSLPSRRKLNTSSEDTVATTATQASTETGATTPTPSQKNMEEYDAEYYQGLPGNPQLLARGTKQLPIEEDPYGNLEYASKKAFAVEVKHDLAVKLNEGLRATIREILGTMNPNKWISTDFLRIGYSPKATDNPVIILVTVEQGSIDKVEAKRIVEELEAACLK